MSLLVGVVPACAESSAPISNATAGSTPAPVLGFTVVAAHRADPTCFVEGLQWTGSGFLESCGLYGSSTIRRTTLDGRVTRRAALPKAVFAEGLVALGTKVYQMTWKDRIVFVRDSATFKDLGTRAMPAALAEGWGMTTDGKSLIASDGTPTIRWIDPKTFAVTRSITVRDGGIDVGNVNELELIEGELWANVWMTNRIVRIDPATGAVRSVVDLGGLRPADTLGEPDSVLNGIAYDPAKKRIFVTGKTWGTMFEIRVAH